MRLVLLLSALAAPAVAAAAPIAPGWHRIAIPATGSYADRYVPASLDQSGAAPLVLFFHGSGGSPTAYRSFVQGAAEAAKCVALLPKSEGFGWGTAEDATTVAESLRLAGEELTIDAQRTAVAGHSAGGAYAYLLAYTTVSRFSGVFSLGARDYPVAAVADLAYTAPIRMYYGTQDPNYTGGSYAALVAQWQRLGVPWEADLQPGYGHNSWPDASLDDGFRFLVAQRYPAASGCVPSDTRLCLNGGRYAVEVAWRDFQGVAGQGRVVPGAAADSGLFWFFGPQNWELLVKVLDGCAVNDHVWVFAAATTTVEHTLVVTDTMTGATARYTNPAGRPAPAITDTLAFAACP
ncbi:MAG TPA: thioesterase domain-containing protein [Thermoanaerobaculia bacterium]